MGGRDVVTGQFQGIVSLDGATDVARTAGEQRITAIVVLMSAQINRNLGLKVRVDLVHEMHHEDVFRRDRAVGLQFEDPVAFRVLLVEQKIPRAVDGPFDRILLGRTQIGLEIGRSFRGVVMIFKHE